MTIKAFDKPSLQAVRADLEAALALIGRKHGISFSLSTMTFGPEQFKVSLSAAVVGEAGEDTTPFGAAHKWTIGWRQLHSALGLPADALGKTISWGGKDAVIGGISPHTSEPVILKIGNRYAKAPVGLVKLRLGPVQKD